MRFAYELVLRAYHYSERIRTLGQHMKKFSQAILLLSISFFAITGVSETTQEPEVEAISTLKKAVFAGGCFWCIEADFEKVDGVKSVVSGYTGGTADTADYKTVTYNETGHFEAVEVSYDPSTVSYSELVEYFWRHIDPTNPRGQFCDRGTSYLSAIFYANDEEKIIVANSLAELEENKPFEGEIFTQILRAKPFYLAEEYHQDYYKKNPIRYNLYRKGCARDRRVKELWGSK